MTTNPDGTPETGLVAVIGLGCVLPDANSIPEFWDNIRNGRSAVREVPKDRWDPSLFYDPDPRVPDKTYATIGAFVTSFRFDPMKFRIPPSSLKSLDDSQLWAIDAAAQCLADAGYDKKEFDRARCAVILGNAMGGEIQRLNNYRFAWPMLRQTLEATSGWDRLAAGEGDRMLEEAHRRYVGRFPEITEDSMPGELSNVIAGRIANILNLGGKNFTTDAACASSLAAIDAAIKTLLYREADLVITGGVDRSMDVSTYVKFSKIGALSARGSFPFDARADGFVMGEGAAMMLLKRYGDAVRDGDRIYAVLRGVGASSDGKGKGITAPNPEGQLKSVRRALLDAGITPADVDLVECHGTSTRVGDVVEIQVLNEIFGPHVTRKQSVPIGSVKSNLGHLKSGAGGASLLKVVLGLHHKVLPPSINFQTPNPNVKWEETPFYVLTQAKPWPEPPGARPRRAGISSFGFGGTNFHLVVEEYAPGKNTPKAAARGASVPAPAPTPPAAAGVSGVLLRSAATRRASEPPTSQAYADVLVVGAASPQALEGEVRRARAAVASLAPRAFTAWLERHNAAAISHPVRAALVVDSPAHAAAQLEKALDGVRDPKKRVLLANQGIHYGEGPLDGKVAFLFPGQGSQYADMMRDLATRYEPVRRTLDDANRVMEPLVGKPLTEFLFSDAAAGRNRDHVEEALKRTEITQPAVLAADAALVRTLAEYGVKPDLVAGHSLGEYGALIAAGVLTFDDALLAVSARGREMASVKVPDLGKMASVTADPATVEAKLRAVTGYVIPANKNCKVQTVIAGASPAVEEAVRLFNAQGIPAQLIPVSAAFHSSIVAPATEPLKRVLQRLDVREPKVPVLSNVHADYYPRGPDAPAQIVDLLARQVAAPVEWQRQIERAYADGARVFVEVGPKSVLTTFVKNILEGRPHLAVAMNHPKKGGFYHVFDTLALLAAHGYPVRFPRPDDAGAYVASFRETLEDPRAATAPAAEPPVVPKLAEAPSNLGTTTAAPGVTGLAFPQLQQAAEQFIRDKQEELRRALLSQFEAASAKTPQTPGAPDGELAALRRRVDALGLNLEPVLITGVSVGTPGTYKKLFDDRNFEHVLEGRNSIEPLTPEDLRRQVEKNVVRLVKSETGDHRFESIRDAAEVIKLAAKKGDFDLVREYGVNRDFAESLDVTSKMAIAAGIEALRDAQIPLVRGYVKTTKGTFLPGEWALPEPLQRETGIIFCSVWPGVPKIIDYVSQNLANRYARRSADERRALYRELASALRDEAARRDLEAWCERHEAELAQGAAPLFEFNRRFLFHVLGMGHSQLAQFIRARGPNVAVNAACATTTQAVGIAEDWIRVGRCRRVVIVGADDITGPEMLEYWASGFLAAGAATTEGDVTKAALPFDKRRHGMIIGMGAVGLVVEAEGVVRERGMDGITEILATTFLNSAYHGSRLDTEHVAQVMDDLLSTVERRTGTPRRRIAERLLFMSHETYTPARGGSAAAEIEALTKTFGPDVSKVVVANTKGFTGHPMAVGIEDAIAIRSLQLGRVPPIANLREPDPALGDIQLSRGGPYDLEYGLRLGAGFGSQVAMYVVKLRSKDLTRIVDPVTYHAWLSRAAGTKNPELEVVNRTLRVKAQLPHLAEAPPPARPTPPAAPAPQPAPRPLVPPVPVAGPVSGRTDVLERITLVVAEKTGYTRDVLDPGLDLEADLGIDTVKQAELFGIVREHYQIARDDSIQLKDYNTLHKIADFIVARSGGAPGAPVPPAAPVARAVAPKLEPAAATGPSHAPARAAGAARDAVLARLTELVAEKTGYTKDLLDPTLDLEADLGIDTVKQAELFGLIRTELNVERDDRLQLKDIQTLSKIADYLHARLGAAPAGASPTHVVPRLETPAANLGTTNGSPPTRPTAGSARDASGVLAAIRMLVAEKTGYPIELLDPDLDLEADLGIDTVKQAELFGIARERYGIPRDDSVQLKDYNTLRKIADFILAGASTDAKAAAPAAAAVVPRLETASANLGTTAPVAAETQPGPPPAPRAGSVSRSQALDSIRATVARKTGYPLDLLDPDLDLEADLGIDTVKQAELFGIVRETYQIPRDDSVQLKDYNTLHKIAAFIAARAGRPHAAPAADAGSPPVAPVAERSTRRYVVRYVGVPAAPAHPKLDGKTLAVWAPPAHRADLLHELRKAGVSPIPMEALPTKLEEAQAWVDEQRGHHGRLNGLVFVPVPSALGTDFGADDARVVKALFWIVKSLLTGAKSGEVDTVAVATFLGGDFAANATQPLNPLDGGLVGLAKAIARELPSATVKALDVPAHTTPLTLAQALVDELGRRDGLVEVGTLGGRGTLRLLEQETAEEEPGFELRRDDVVLVAGGGSGITSDVVRALARGAPAAFVLLGRTPLHADAARLAQFTEQEWNGKRVEVQAELKAKGERVTPVTVDRALGTLRKSAEIHATLESLRALGGRAEYHALDVTDAASVRQLVADVRRRLGRPTGVLHAAGIEESKLIVDKTSASFDRVFDVKVLGARNLLEATREDPLRFFVAFSSIAGRFGNAGQADYSAANDALAKLCAALRLERGRAFPATAIDWSAWADKGMATRGSVMAVLREAGVTPIPLAEGVRRCLDEFQHGLRDPEVLVAGDLGRLASPDAFTRREEVLAAPVRAAPTAPKPAPAVTGTGQQVLVVETQPEHGTLVMDEVESDGRTATSKLLLDPAKEPYLKDHRVDGVPYLPGVLGVEAFAEVASRLAPRKVFVGARDVDFRLPVKCLRDQPLEVTIVASVASDSDGRTEVGCRLQSVFVNAKGERLGAPRIHFTGTLLFEATRPAAPAVAEPTGDLERIIEKKELYDQYFHGPSFRVAQNVGLVTDGRTTLGIWADPRAPPLADRPPRFVTNPLLHELAFQTAGAHELFRGKWMSLPKAEGRFKYHRDPPDGAAVRAVATFKRLEENVAHFDVVVATTEGEALIEIQDFQLIRLRPLEAGNGGPAPGAPATPPASPESVYRARWGRDVPLPAPGVVGVVLDQRDLETMAVTDAESLTSGERADQQRYRNEARAREFFAGRLAAKEAIAQLLGRPVREARGIEIRRLETGEPRPRGTGLEDVLVSITHSGALALAVAARRAGRLHTLGVDLERIEAKSAAFEDQAFTEAERRLIDRLAASGRRRPEVQILFWATKEAVLKALGKGFALDLHDVQIQDLDDDGRATVMLAEPARRVLRDLAASHVTVQTWVLDGFAYALAWTQI